MRLKKEKVNGTRPTDGDSDDSGSGDSPGFATGGVVPGRKRSRKDPYGFDALCGSFAELSRKIQEIENPAVPVLPTSERDETIEAWKVARLCWSPQSGVYVRPLNRSGTIGVEAVAECRKNLDFGFYTSTIFGGSQLPQMAVVPHSSPDLGCHCGFYAISDRAKALAEGTNVLLHVEFYGRVVVYETGYRAEKQRIMRIELPPTCMFCPNPATTVVVPQGYVDTTEKLLVGRCDRHIHHSDVPLDLADVATLVGTEVVFA